MYEYTKHQQIIAHIKKEDDFFMKINEIFNSIQGEGPYTGTPATFLRLSGCNLNCKFCDTNHEQKQELSINMVKNIIYENMEKHRTQILVITGGEPLLQYNELKQLIQQLNCPVQIETNGTIMKVPLNACYIISPKKDIEKIFKFYKNYDKTYFKFIIENQSQLQQVKQLIQENNYYKTIYFQPEYSKAQEITKLILKQSPNIKYKISGQLHKYLGVE